MSLDFLLDKKLSQDSYFVADLELSQIRLMNCTDFIWLLLIPRLAQAVHYIDLSAQNQTLLFKEINQISCILSKHFSPDRLNIGSLGNIVQQMHWHVIVRHETDTLWPAPVWGQLYNKFQDNSYFELIEKIKNDL